ncbi:flagellar biosynthetic protein FliO [Lysobacter sp. F60174L2]|uniref:flagellar biosynthetic protein FliO n=1 Tax=Lysobacter sp. F60174L2 TaxID=3459295 RepID=UPI00403DC20C
MVGTTVVTLLLVIGFILLLGWLAKRMPGLGGASNPALKVVGSLALGPRDRVVVVAVGDTQLLLATGPGGTRTLHTLEQPLPMPANTPSPFAQVLAQQFGKKPS